MGTIFSAVCNVAVFYFARKGCFSLVESQAMATAISLDCVLMWALQVFMWTFAHHILSRCQTNSQRSDKIKREPLSLLQRAHFAMFSNCLK